MALELRHLRGFVAVAQTLHFARAAETLGLSAPALTEQIQALERDLGTLLLRRTKRSVALTPAGEAFLAEAQATLAQFERSVAVGRRAGQGALGRVVLGYVGSAVYAGVLQALVERFRTSHPDVTLQIQEQPMDRLPAMLEDGQVDVAFVRLPMAVPAALRAQVLVRDHFCLALPAGHPLAAAQAPVPARSLAQASFVAPEQTFGLQEVARRGRFEPRVVLAPGSLVAVLAQVSLGVGVAVVPSLLQGVIELPQVVFRALAGARIPSELGAVYRRHERDPAVRAFLQQLPPAQVAPEAGAR